MKNDKKTSVLIALLIILALTCIALGCGWSALSWIYEDEETVLVDKCVAIDLSEMPAQPTERYWYDLTVEILKDNGWDLPMNVTGMGYSGLISCEPTPPLYITDLYFKSSYFDGITPSAKFASVKLNLISETASVVITSKSFVWPKKSTGLDISRMTVDYYEAFKMADDFSGREFRNKVGNACEINMSLANNRWSFRYRESGKQWENWGIKINVFTGKLERPELP